MTEGEVVAAVIAWAEETVEEVAGNTYAYLPAAKIKGLPDCAVEILTMRVTRNDPDFALIDLQQTWIKRRDLAVNFMVAAPAAEADHLAAQEQLRTMVDRLVDALLADHTLGGRVPLASPVVDVDYDPAFIEYQDGTRGREVVVQIAVGEPLVYED